MGIFSAPNRAQNITIDEGSALLAKFSKLGLYFGPLHANDASGGPSVANIVPLDEVEDKSGMLNLQAWAGGNWHNVGLLKLTFGEGGVEGFKRVYNDIYPGVDATAALINIPGANAAIDKLIRKA